MRIVIFEYMDKYTKQMTTIQREFNPNEYKDSEIFKEMLCLHELNDTYTVVFSDL